MTLSTITPEGIGAEIAVTDEERHERAVLLTEEIREAAQRFAGTAFDLVQAKDTLLSLIDKAERERVHEALGYKAWPKYVADVFATVAMPPLTKDDQRALVSFLWQQGMSTRAIVPIAGVSQKTVSRWTEGMKPSGDEKRMVMGLDGKTRHTPAPKATRVAEPRADLSDLSDEQLRAALVEQAALDWNDKDSDFLLALAGMVGTIREELMRRARAKAKAERNAAKGTPA